MFGTEQETARHKKIRTDLDAPVLSGLQQDAVKSKGVKTRNLVIKTLPNSVTELLMMININVLIGYLLVLFKTLPSLRTIRRSCYVMLCYVILYYLIHYLFKYAIITI